MSVRVLVVEDSPSMRHILVSGVKEVFPEFVVHEAEDGAFALKMMRNSSIDILLTDINMPVMDGLKLVGMVRKDPKHKNIPIVIISTESARKDRKGCLDLGADAYFVKPVKMRELVTEVERLLVAAGFTNIPKVSV
ncbi:MAG: response regulator [Myxococcota bacterium]|nr:response regulator [Myxococcota bacterium]